MESSLSTFSLSLVVSSFRPHAWEPRLPLLCPAVGGRYSPIKDNLGQGYIASLGSVRESILPGSNQGQYLALQCIAADQTSTDQQCIWSFKFLPLAFVRVSLTSCLKLLQECLGEESTSGLSQISVALRSGRAEEPGPPRVTPLFPSALALSHPDGQPLKPITVACFNPRLGEMPYFSYILEQWETWRETFPCVSN